MVVKNVSVTTPPATTVLVEDVAAALVVGEGTFDDEVCILELEDATRDEELWLVDELNAGMAPTLLMKTAESRRASCRSHSTKEIVCAPGVVVWLNHIGGEVNSYWLVCVEVLDQYIGLL